MPFKHQLATLAYNYIKRERKGHENAHLGVAMLLIAAIPGYL